MNEKSLAVDGEIGNSPIELKANLTMVLLMKTKALSRLHNVVTIQTTTRPNIRGKLLTVKRHDCVSVWLIEDFKGRFVENLNGCQFDGVVSRVEVVCGMGEDRKGSRHGMFIWEAGPGYGRLIRHPRQRKEPIQLVQGR